MFFKKNLNVSIIAALVALVTLQIFIITISTGGAKVLSIISLLFLFSSIWICLYNLRKVNYRDGVEIFKERFEKFDDVKIVIDLVKTDSEIINQYEKKERKDRRIIPFIIIYSCSCLLIFTYEGWIVAKAILMLLLAFQYILVIRIVYIHMDLEKSYSEKYMIKESRRILKILEKKSEEF